MLLGYRGAVLSADAKHKHAEANGAHRVQKEYPPPEHRGRARPVYQAGKWN